MDLNPSALRAIRERSGLSVTALAELSGIKQSHLLEHRGWAAPGIS